MGRAGQHASRAESGLAAVGAVRLSFECSSLHFEYLSGVHRGIRRRRFGDGWGALVVGIRPKTFGLGLPSLEDL